MEGESAMESIRWDERGLAPAVVQDAHTGQVLMMAYMNGESLARTLDSGETWFWSRSRGELWHKGATSGHTQKVVEVRYDCDADTLLVRVEPAGPACHTNRQSCFYRRLPDGAEVGPPPSAGGALPHLEAVVRDRKAHPKPGSYTCSLLEEGLPRIAQKVGEEGVETVVAALAQDDGRVVSEMADLIYHATVLLVQRGLSWRDVEDELVGRFGR